MLQVLRDFGQFGDVVDVRGPGLFDVTGDDVYVRYKEKSSAEQALIELVGRYDSLCLAPPSDIQADKFGYFTITFVNVIAFISQFACEKCQTIFAIVWTRKRM